MPVRWRRVARNICLLLALVGLVAGIQLFHVDAPWAQSTEVEKVVAPQHGGVHAESLAPAQSPELRRGAARSDRDQDRRVQTTWELVGIAALIVSLAVLFRRARRAHVRFATAFRFSVYGPRAPPLSRAALTF
jgi:hypothetical protein